MTSTSLVPASDDLSAWDLIVQQANVLAKSSIVPKAYQRKPDDIIAAAMYGREVGFGVTTSLALIDMIEGNATINAEGKVALVRGAGHSIAGTVDNMKAVVTGKRSDTGDTMTVTFSMEDAARANLANKQNWKQHPSDMLWARAVSALCRRLFPDVCIGLSYTPEEVEAFTSPPELVNETAVNGIRPPTAIEAAVAAHVTEPLADPDVRVKIAERLKALKAGNPESAKALAAEWKSAGIPPFASAERFTVSDGEHVVALLDEFEKEPVLVPDVPGEFPPGEEPFGSAEERA